jgi:ATP synthase protein I
MAADPKSPNEQSEKKPGDAFDELVKRRRDESASQQMFALSGIGFEFITVVGGAIVLGWWLDRTLETKPWLTLVGVAIGFTIGLARLVAFGKRTMK